MAKWISTFLFKSSKINGMVRFQRPRLRNAEYKKYKKHPKGRLKVAVSETHDQVWNDKQR